MFDTMVLTDNEKELIAELVERGHDEDFEVPVRSIEERWRASKEHIFSAFGNRTIIEQPYSFTAIENLWQARQEFSAMINAIENSNIRSAFDLFDLEELAFNKVIRRNRYASPGVKITTVVKEICRAESTKQLEESFVFYSRFIQQFKVKGILCLSIHPLDFFTMSHNRSGWSTCQSPGGEKQAGILSLLYDQSTIVAYVKSETDADYSNYGSAPLFWNNKKWRQLIHWNGMTGNEGIVVTNNTYPYVNENITNQIVTMVTNLFSIPHNRPSPCPLEREAVWNNDDAGLFYSDLRFGESYIGRSGMILDKEHFDKGHFIAVGIGSNAMCLKCERDYIDNSEVMLCDNCFSSGHFCEECGDRVYEDDMWLDNRGYVYCSYCFDERYRVCDYCGYVTEVENSFRVEDENGFLEGPYCGPCARSVEQEVEKAIKAREILEAEKESANE